MDKATFMETLLVAEEIRFMRQFIHPGSVVVDGGSSVGTHTLSFSRFCGNEGRTIAVESSPELFIALSANAAASHLGNVTCLHGTLSDTRSEGYPPTVDVVERKDVRTQRTSVPQSIVLDELGLDRVDFIKLSSAGAELAALKGAQQLIRSYAPIIFLQLSEAGEGWRAVTFLGEFRYRTLYCEFTLSGADASMDVNVTPVGQGCRAALLFLPSRYRTPLVHGNCKVLSFSEITSLRSLLQSMPEAGSNSIASVSRQIQNVRNLVVSYMMRNDVESSESRGRTERSALHLESDLSRESRSLAQEIEALTSAFNHVKSEVSELKRIVLGRHEDRASLVLQLVQVSSRLAKLENKKSFGASLLDRIGLGRKRRKET